MAWDVLYCAVRSQTLVCVGQMFENRFFKLSHISFLLWIENYFSGNLIKVKFFVNPIKPFIRILYD